jgi:hypothetical protein
MKGRTARATALLFAAVCLATSTALALMDVLVPATHGGGPVVPLEVVPVALFLWGTPLLGVLVAVRRPENPVGWLLMLTAFGWALSFGVDDLAHRGVDPGLAGPLAIAQQVSAVGFLGLVLLLLFFPNGRLPSPRWRILPVAAVVGSVAGAIAGLFAPGSVVDDPPIPELANPFGRPAWVPALDLLGSLSQLAFVAVIVGSIAVLVIRARRSRGTERQQLKWFASAGALCALLFIGALVVGTIAPDSELGTVLWALGLSSLFLVPLAAALAILRYRLYDIDRIISRTIAYAIVTALLAGAYAAAFVAIAALLAPLTANDGPVAVAASTLVVFALFAPVRRRTQAIVDRRFDRSRYDAEQTVAQLVERLRDETDLRQLGADVETAARVALAPTVVTLWTRGE